MANQTVYPYGQGGQLPSGYPIADDLKTNSAQYALSAKQGVVIDERLSHIEKTFKLFWENSSSANWLKGNMSSGKIVTSYSNRYIILTGFKSDATSIIISRGESDNSFTMNCYLSDDGTNWGNTIVQIHNGEEKTISPNGKTHLLLLLWDKPTTEQANAEQITITEYSDRELLGKEDVVDAVTSTDVTLPLSANQGRLLNERIDSFAGGGEYNLTWVTGNIDTSTGILDPSYANKSTDYIYLMAGKFTIHNPTNYKVKICCYDSSRLYLGCESVVSPNEDKEVTPLSDTQYIRLTAWEKPSDNDVANISMSFVCDKSLYELQQYIEAIRGGLMFNNPVLQVDAPDPCIVNGMDGYFYMLGTGQLESRTMYRSTNLVDWEEADRPFTDNAIADCYADLGVSSVGFWAPEIVKVGNKYNLYCSRQASPMLVFQSDHPNFGYEYKGKIITTSNGLASDNIDACVRYDLDGTLWMFWGSTYGMYRQKLSADGLTLDANDTKVHVAGNLLSQDRSRATVFEGAYLYRRKGYWYLFVSAGLYTGNTYCLKVGRSATLTGAFVDKDGNDMAEGNATTILSSASGDALYGPGHNGQIITDRNNKTFMMYHSHYTGASSTSQRYICLQEILWDEEGWPYFSGGKPQLSGNVKPQL